MADIQPPRSPQPSPEPEPNAAQILLQAFHLPPIPAQLSALKHLTLISDIKPTDYASLLSAPLSADAIPDSLPKSVESLTLELFSLGYPARFLSGLGKALPGLKEVTLFSHLFDGVSEESRRDAGEFMSDVLRRGGDGGVRGLYLVDTFCRKGFLAGVGSILGDRAEGQGGGVDTMALRFLEVSYTYRGHSDPGFLSNIPGDELPSLIVPSLTAVAFRLAPASESTTDSQLFGGLPNDPADVDENGNRIAGQKPQGIIPLPSTHQGTDLLMEKLTLGKVEGLGLLDCTLYAITLSQVADILSYQRALSMLRTSVLVHADLQTKKALLDTLQYASKALDTVEIVGVPADELNKEVSLSPSPPYHSINHN